MPALDELTIHWQWALEAGSRALDAAEPELGSATLARHRGVLGHERVETAGLLAGLAHDSHAGGRPWLSQVPVTPRLLGLPDGTEACIFDVDRVLADAGVVHARAWAQVLDAVLLRRADESGLQFVPFTPAEDYHAYLDGRPRLDGIRTFLASRGITLPPATIQQIADAKAAALEHTIDRAGVVALPGARTYLLAAAFAHLKRAVVSTSSTTAHVLEHAELASLVDACVDGRSLTTGLRPRPAPDLLLAACEALGVSPDRSVAVTRSAEGVAAAKAAGMAAVAIGDGERLSGLGATRIVPSLAVLIDPRLRASANGSF